MINKVWEVIPFKTFKERLNLTKSFEKNGIIPENLGNCLLVNYNINGGVR